MNTEEGRVELRNFLIVYFYTIENQLNKDGNGLKDVKFQSEEANTDEHLKKYFQMRKIFSPQKISPIKF